MPGATPHRFSVSAGGCSPALTLETSWGNNFDFLHALPNCLTGATKMKHFVLQRR